VRSLDNGGRKALSARADSTADAIVGLYTCFASIPSGGNTAGVVLTRDPVDVVDAQAMARRLGAATTAFVARSEVTTTGLVRARFFTPTAEIGGCGHATLALIRALTDEGMSASTWVVEAAGGRTSARLLPDGWIELSIPARVERFVEPTSLDVERALGLASEKSLPLAVASTTLRHLLVPIRSADLARIRLSRSRITRLAHDARVDTVAVFSRSRAGRLRMRDLCAAIGELEEPASGTTAAALGRYVQALFNEALLHIDQGVEMGSPSLLRVRCTPTETTVAGSVTRTHRGAPTPRALGPELQRGRGDEQDPSRGPEGASSNPENVLGT
jgi:PhzF family phenazine biosynthesis protein